MRIRLLYFLALTILAGCTGINVHKTLKDVETYIAQRPDSALAVLEAMDTTDLKTKGLRAHHALLHAMALDKNWIDVTDDSLALKAVNYYQKRGSRRNYARSLYYLALTYFRSEQYEKSMNYLSMAEKVAEEHDSLYLGFVKVLQADAYDLNYNNIEHLNCLEKAFEIYSNIGADYYIYVAKLGLAGSYIDNEKYTQAENILRDLIDSERITKSMQLQAIGDYAFLMVVRPDPEYSLASEYYEKVASEEGGKYMSAQDYWVWAFALSEIGDFDRCEEIVNDIKHGDSSGTSYYFRYLIAKNKGDNLKALDFLEKYSDKNNEEVVQILKQSVSTIQRDFYQSQYEITEVKAANRLLVIIFIIVAVALCCTIVSICIIRYRKKKELEKEHYIRYAEEVNRQLRDFKQDTYSSLQKKYISMYKTKYETLGTLFDQYVQSDGRVDSEHLVYRKVVSLIDELRTEIGSNDDFESMLNNDLDGIMIKLRSALPDLKKKDYTLFGYFALGFDATIISHFMDCTVNTIYIRRSRLKKAIEESDSEHRNLFLEIIA